MRVLAHRIQIAALGDPGPAKLRRLRDGGDQTASFINRSPATRDGVDLKPGAIVAREWRSRLERVTVLKDGFAWNGTTYGSLSMVARAITGTSWNGHRFFGLKAGRRGRTDGRAGDAAETPGTSAVPPERRWGHRGSSGAQDRETREGGAS